MAEPAAAAVSQLRSAYTAMRMRLRAARTEAERQEIRGWLKRLERARDAESRLTVEFVVAPWMFGEGPPDDPFPCTCGDGPCPHGSEIQAWFARMEEREVGDPALD